MLFNNFLLLKRDYNKRLFSHICEGKKENNAKAKRSRNLLVLI